MTAQNVILTERERVENALDQLAHLREQVRLQAHAAGSAARVLFSQIDVELREELAQPRPRTPALVEIGRKLRALRASIQPH